MHQVERQKALRHLVFAAKDTGQRCIEFLLNEFPRDEYTFVLCEPGADAIAEMLAQRGIQSMRLSEATLDLIRAVSEHHYDWLLNLWGGYIFKADILSRARQSLNIHPAYLPYCRGRDPVVWAISKEYPAGVTLHAITPGVDEGPIWYREEVSYKLPITGGLLYERVVKRCWEAFCEQWKGIHAGKVGAVAQATSADVPTYKRADLLADRVINLDTDLQARKFALRLMAHDFAPGYSAQVAIDGQLYAATLTLTPLMVSADKAAAGHQSKLVSTDLKKGMKNV